MNQNISEGSFKFVVLMDTMHNQLRDLILYMNQNSKFDIYGVELECYKHEKLEIIIPKLFGAEVKKDVTAKKSDTTYITDDEFILEFAAIGLEDKIREVLKMEKQYLDGASISECWKARRTPKNINFSYVLPGDKLGYLVLSIGKSKSLPSETIDFWLYEKGIEDRVVDAVSEILKIPTKRLAATAKYGVVARWPLKDINADKLTAFFSTVESTASS